MISLTKVNAEKDNVIKNCSKCDGKGCGYCFKYCSFIDKMAEAEIPVDYWFRKMDEFYGDPNFKNMVQDYIKDIKGQYSKGLIYCFVGPRGTGKTMAGSEILKSALLHNYTAHYTTMVDAVAKMLAPNSYNFRAIIKQADFFFLDEVDQRFFASQGSQELFGNHFENIIRTRSQNKMPTIMCSNSVVDQIFDGQFKESLDSLKAQFMKVFVATSLDARKGQEKL